MIKKLQLKIMDKLSRRKLQDMLSYVHKINSNTVIPFFFTIYDKNILKEDSPQDLPFAANTKWSHLPSSPHCVGVLDTWWVNDVSNSLTLAKVTDEYRIYYYYEMNVYFYFPNDLLNSPQSYMESLIERFRSVIDEEKRKSSNDISSQMENIRKIVLAREQATKQGIKYED